MNLAVDILKHALDMIFRNPLATLRATFVGVAIILVSAFVGTGLIVLNGEDIAFSDRPEDYAGVYGSFLLVFLTYGIGTVVMVAAWHRYVLLDDAERTTPPARIVLIYIWLTILLALMLIPIMIPVAIVLIPFAAGGLGGGGLMLLNLVVTILVGAILTRLSLVLPAAAIDQPMGIGDSWRATKPYFGTIIALTVLMAVFDLILTQMLGLVVGSSPVLANVTSLISQVLVVLVSASLLTTLYGVIVQGRTLD